MKRRRALQQIGWGLSGGMILPSVLTGCADEVVGPEIVYDGTVAVIGAGAAGLYAADILRSKGVKVKVFEARDQIGGRIRSLRHQNPDLYPMYHKLSSDFPLELGAQWVSGSDSIIARIYQDYNLPITEIFPENSHFVLDNVAKSVADWGGDPDFVAAMNFRNNLTGHVGNAQTVLQAIQAAGIPERAHGMLNGQIGNAYGASNTLAGIGELAEEETLRTTDNKLIALTANPLQDMLVSRFSETQPYVQLNTPIKSINYGVDPILLTAEDGTVYEANKVIVAVPVSMLKSGGITFEPGLPGGHTSSLAKIGMGASLRMILEFKKNFWGDSVSYIAGNSNVPEFFSAGVGRSKTNFTLAVTINGEKGAQYSAMGEGAVDAVIADIDAIYAGQGSAFIRQEIEEPKRKIVVMEDWTKLDHIKGGYSYPMAGATNADRLNIGQPLANKLFFAGEATDITGQAGMVNGALASAERVVEEVKVSIVGG